MPMDASSALAQVHLEQEPHFVDAEGGAVLYSSSMPIRAPISDDVEEEEEEDDDEPDEDEDAEGEDEADSFVSGESYDSAPERIAVATTPDGASPVGSFTESSLVDLPSDAVSSSQQGALLQLNELNSGVSSLDTTLLDNSSEDEFKSRVAKIAETQNLSPHEEVVRSILDALLPMVRGRFKRCDSPRENTSQGANGSADFSGFMPVAKPTVEDDDDTPARNDGLALKLQLLGMNGTADIDQGEVPEGDELQSESARGLRVRGAEYDSEEHEYSPVDTRASLSSSELPQEAGVRPLAADTTRKANASSVAGKEILAEEEDESQINSGGEPEPKGKGEADACVEHANIELPNGNEESNPISVAPETGSELDLDGCEGGLSSNGGIALQSQEIGTVEQAADETSSLSSPVGFKGGAQNEPKGATEEQEDAKDTPEAKPNGKRTPGSNPEAVTHEEEKLSPEAKLEAVTVTEGEEKEIPEAEPEVFPEEEERETPEAKSSLKLGGSSLVLEEEQPDAKKKEKEDLRSLEEEAQGDKGGAVEAASESSCPPAASVNCKPSSSASDAPPSGGAGPALPGRPPGLGRSIPSLEHAPRALQRSTGAPVPPPSRTNEDNQLNSDVLEGNDEAREKLHNIRIKFLRLAHRLGQSAHHVVVAQVLYRLGLAEQLRGGWGPNRTAAFSFERASIQAEEQEIAGQNELDFGCTIMVLGKSGVGKSATINTLFDEQKSGTDAYKPATKKVQEINGTIHGIKLRVIDTPGLLPSYADQRHNERVMSAVKRSIKKSPPDIVLYFDRLDMQSRDYGDLPLLRTITDAFGAAVWFNAIVVLTHASSAPPDGANGLPLSYEMFVAQRSHVVQQTIRQAAGDMRLMNPVSLVENHAACRTNRAGQRVLPNGQVWKPQLLLLCFASKILAEANSLLKLQDSSSPGKPLGVRSRVPPLPFLLSSLLQSRAQLKLPDEQMGDDDESGISSDEEEDSDGEEEYDDLPPFRRLTREELGLLDDEQRHTYFEELDYREKLFMKQQWKQERLRRREMRRRMASVSKEEFQSPEENIEEENAGAASVPVPMPDMALPPSFDADNPSHRYRYLDTSSQWLVRPVLETHGWDHDSGYDGLNIEKMFVISKKIPVSVSGQVTKDKKEANMQMECAASFKHGEGKVTMTGIDVQTIGKDLAYTLRSATRFSNFKRNKTTCGLAVTFLGDTVAAGMKLEDRLMVGRRLKLVVNGGALTGRGDVAYGGSLEATLRDEDHPIGRTLSTLGLSIMDWHGDLAIGCNLQSQFMLGKTMMIARANLNNRGAGQFSIRASSTEQLQMALIGLIPLLRTFIGNRSFSSSQPMQ